MGIFRESRVMEMNPNNYKGHIKVLFATLKKNDIPHGYRSCGVDMIMDATRAVKVLVSNQGRYVYVNFTREGFLEDWICEDINKNKQLSLFEDPNLFHGRIEDCMQHIVNFVLYESTTRKEVVV